MKYLVFDIPEGISIEDFLRDISCHNYIKPKDIATLIQENLTSDDYYIRIEPADGGAGKVGLKELTERDIANLLFHRVSISKQGYNLVKIEGKIFKHKPQHPSRPSPAEAERSKE